MGIFNRILKSLTGPPGPPGPMGPMGRNGHSVDYSLLEDMVRGMKSNHQRIEKLEKLLDMVIEDPEKAKELRRIDPYGEEIWE